jgi:hypothetical protein
VRARGAELVGRWLSGSKHQVMKSRRRMLSFARLVAEMHAAARTVGLWLGGARPLARLGGGKGLIVASPMS